VMRDVEHDDGSSSESRFLLEARLASQLSRKTRHIISVTDHGEDGPYAYLAMELLEGESLDARLARKGPMSIGKVVPLVYQIARALSVAHADGIVHRDLKPSNVFVTVDEDHRALIKILDFGIAKLRASMRRIPTMNDAKHTTLRGFLLGTPAYMSPEQARGKAIDHRADVWALAVIAYHLLSGEFPFDGETADELFHRLVNVDPIPIEFHRPELPPSVATLFDQAFAKKIENRFQSAVALASALEQIATKERRAFGEMPAAMNSISLPPPSKKIEAPLAPEITPTPPPRKDPAVTIHAPKHATEESSIVAAGVPRKRAIWTRLAAAAVVLVMLFMTASAITLYLERDANNQKPTATATGLVPPPVREDDRNIVPSPPRTAETKILPPTSDQQPVAITPQPIMRPPSAAPARPTTTTASLPPQDPPSVVPAIVVPPPSPAARKIDNRSEVF
jgi:serine/threonine protein kinase